MSAQRSLVRRWTRLLAGIAAGTLMLTATGCSSGGGAAGSGGDLTAAEQQCVDNAKQYLDTRGLLPASLPTELTPLSEPPATGLTVTRIAAASVPTDVEVSRRLVESLPVVGWTGKAVTYDGSVEDANRKLLEGIGNSDIVIISGVPIAALQRPIEAAEDKGVLLMLDGTEPPRSVPGFGATPLGGDMWARMGEPAAYSVLQATGCRGKVAVFGVAAPAMRELAAGVEDVVRKECAECGYSYTELPFSDIGSPAATNAVISKLQADPSIEFAFFTIGDLARGIEPALKQAGIQVEMGGALPGPANLSSLKQGRNSFWVGVPQDMTAWVTLDTAVRALDSGEPTVGNHFPLPIFTPGNIESTDVVPAYPTDYRAQFQKLWKITS
ncbi:hypothetical protein [Nocardia sp. NPDC019395]|uniref:sugar ABC transporter substrate-binding protein n=1 Tax=Nocardia sp. NPDC019395 TaxID=3154686 RepID=UPI0033D9A931